MFLIKDTGLFLYFHADNILLYIALKPCQSLDGRHAVEMQYEILVFLNILNIVNIPISCSIQK